MSAPSLYDGPSMHHFTRVRSFDDSEQYLGNGKQAGKNRGFPEDNAVKNFTVDKEKASNVAKIKVVVSFFYYFHFSLRCIHAQFTVKLNQ